MNNAAIAENTYLIQSDFGEGKREVRRRGSE
jgi:hypothetical protein